MSNGHKSVKYSALSGVPQGSKLVSLLFIIFINDIEDIIDVECLLLLYDLKNYSMTKNISDCLILASNIQGIEM